MQLHTYIHLYLIWYYECLYRNMLVIWKFDKHTIIHLININHMLLNCLTSKSCFISCEILYCSYNVFIKDLYQKIVSNDDKTVMFLFRMPLSKHVVEAPLVGPRGGAAPYTQSGLNPPTLPGTLPAW